MRGRFSKGFRSFEEWLTLHPTPSPYAQRIAKGHARYPSATLSQLRRHPAAFEAPLSLVTRAPPSRIPPRLMSPREFETRGRALHALALARREGYSLSKAAAIARTTPDTARRYTGAFRKRGGRYHPTRHDRLERWMYFYEDGHLTVARVPDSRTASLLGEYGNAVKAYLDTRDPKVLDPYRSVTFVDADGRVHQLETNGQRLVAAAERTERDYGQFEIYAELEDVVG